MADSLLSFFCYALQLLSFPPLRDGHMTGHVMYGKRVANGSHHGESINVQCRQTRKTKAHAYLETWSRIFQVGKIILCDFLPAEKSYSMILQVGKITLYDFSYRKNHTAWFFRRGLEKWLCMILKDLRSKGPTPNSV